MANDTRFPNIDLSCLQSSTFSTVSVTVSVVVCIATIFGNILILISIYKYPITFKENLYMLIGNLAVADLLLGLWLLVFIYEEVVPEVQKVWYFCVTKLVGVHISYCCSILCLLGISVDRFMAVIFPLRHFAATHQRKFYIIYLILIWILSIILGSLPNILPNLDMPKTTFVCVITVIMHPDFDLVCSVVLLLLILINLTLYVIVIWKIKTKEAPGTSNVRKQTGTSNVRKQTGTSNVRKQSTKTLLMITVSVVFVICWLPVIICSFITQFSLSPPIFQNVICTRGYLTNLGFVNSALNWVIYGVANTKFRKAFREILCCTSIWKHHLQRQE